MVCKGFFTRLNICVLGKESSVFNGDSSKIFSELVAGNYLVKTKTSDVSQYDLPIYEYKLGARALKETSRTAIYQFACGIFVDFV